MGRGMDVEAGVPIQKGQSKRHHGHHHHGSSHHYQHHHQGHQQHHQSHQQQQQQQQQQGSNRIPPNPSQTQVNSPEYEEEGTTWPRPYLSPGLSRTYRKAWQMEIAIGVCIVVVGLVCLLVDHSPNWTLGAGAIGIGMMVVGSISITMGLCWAANVKAKKKRRKRKSKSLDKQPIMASSPSQEFDGLHSNSNLSSDHTLLPPNRMV